MEKIKSIWIKYRLLIPLGIITFLCLQTIYKYLFKTQQQFGLTFDYYLSTKHYISFGVVILNWFVFFMYRPAFKFIFGTTLILGLCNILNYTIATRKMTYSVFAGEHSAGLTFQPISLYLLIMTYIICFQTVNRIISKPFRLSPEQADQLKLEETEKDKAKFLEKYSNYSNETLSAILEKTEYTEGARQAARQILDDRLEKGYT